MKKHTLIKLFSIIMLAFMLLALASCGGDRTTTDTETEQKKTVTLTFDADGGEIDGEETVEYTAGSKITSLPKVTKEDYNFLGWFTSAGSKVKLPLTINDDMTLTASWQLKSSEPSDTTDTDTGTQAPAPGDTETDTQVPAPGDTETDTQAPAPGDTDSDTNTVPEKVTLTFDANGGEIVDGEESRQATPGKTFRLFPTVEREGYTFVCWLIDNEEELEGDSITVPNQDTTFVAYWKKNASVDDGGNDSSDTDTDTDTGTQVPDGPTVTITLILNGGTLPDGKAEEFQVPQFGKIGALPTPTRPGYTFNGWFEDGNERWEVDKKTEVEDYDMEIHALWTANGETVTVEFLLNADETLSVEDTYFEMISGERISGFIKTLPTATKAGYKFKAWVDSETGATVTVTTKIEKDTVLKATWTQVMLCLDGTENHPFMAWQQSSEATCTDPEQMTRTCSACGHIEYNVIKEALGHGFGNWQTTISESGVVRSRACVRCEATEADPLENIAYSAFKTPVVDGELWGDAPGPNLFDGDYEMNNKKSFAGKGTGAIVVTTEAKEAVYVDIIAMTGYGSAPYNVVVTLENGDTKDLGLGSFGSGEGATKAFTVGAKITKIVVKMDSCSIGSDYWVELSILVVPTTNEE